MTILDRLAAHAKERVESAKQRVSLDEIKAVVKQNFDQTVDFVDVPLAEQYRQSELMRK